MKAENLQKGDVFKSGRATDRSVERVYKLGGDTICGVVLSSDSKIETHTIYLANKEETEIERK